MDDAESLICVAVNLRTALIMVLDGVRLDGLGTSAPFPSRTHLLQQKQPGDGSLLRVPSRNDVQEGQHARRVLLLNVASRVEIVLPLRGPMDPFAEVVDLSNQQLHHLRAMQQEMTHQT